MNEWIFYLSTQIQYSKNSIEQNCVDWTERLKKHSQLSIFIYHTRTEHKIQKYGRLPEKLQLTELAAYANQTKLFSMNCNNNTNKGQ